MKKILCICHIVENRFDGQQSKTNDVISSFKNRGYEIDILNYGSKSIFKAVLAFFKKVKSHNNILLLPGGKRALYLYTFLSKFYKKKNFYYLAIGGWVSGLIENKKSRRKLKPLKKFKRIVLQNTQTVELFKSYGYNNVTFIPTFSSKKQITEDEFNQSLLSFDKAKEYRFCFFARIEETKGIFEACNVIKRLVGNNYNVKLDIYGQIQKKELEEKITHYLDSNIRYMGVIHDDSIKILSSYYCMLFPTYYPGEGMAHSIIESFMGGLPVIASDWHFNSELVKDNETGFLIDLDKLEENLYNKIVFSINNKDLIRKMRYICFEQSKQYNSDAVLKPFIDYVDEMN